VALFISSENQGVSMTIKLASNFAANGKVEDYDVRQMKKVLNRIGYYQPYEKVGITGIPDQAVFDALKAFQKDHGLPPTGEARPDDETIITLSRESDKTPDGYYTWRTVEDGKVRKEHAQYNRTVRAWSDSPDPGENYNCRCWAEPVADSAHKNNCDEERKQYEELHGRVKELSEKFNDLLLRLDKLKEENNRLIQSAQKSLGAQIVAYILTLPLEKFDALSELLQRYFGNIISNKLMQAHKRFYETSLGNKTENSIY
jgi:hypothetical protein